MKDSVNATTEHDQSAETLLLLNTIYDGINFVFWEFVTFITQLATL